MDSVDLTYIKIMEEYYDTLCQTLSKKHSFANLNQEEKAMLSCLIEYYEGGQWLKDYEADEKGFIPNDMKRGILAEDTLYNFLYTYEE